MVFLDSAAASEFGVQVFPEGIQVYLAFGFQALEQIFQQILGIAVLKEIWESAHCQGIVTEGFHFHAYMIEFLQEGKQSRLGGGPQMHHLRGQEGLNGPSAEVTIYYLQFTIHHSLFTIHSFDGGSHT